MFFDVVIIGAGIMGAAMAQVLMGYNARIAVLEKGGDVCMGASKANSGIIHAGFDAAPHTKKARYNVEGAKMYPALCDMLGVAYVKCGALVIGFNEEDKKTLAKLYDQGISNGVCGMALVTGEEALKLEKNLNPEVACALHVPTSGVVSPYEMTFALMEHAVVNGVKVYTNQNAVDITREEDGYRILCEGGGGFSAKAVINCAGAGALAIHRLIVQDDLRIVPRKGDYYLLDRMAELPFTRTIFQCPTKMGKGILVSPTAHGNTLIGPSAIDVDDAMDTATDAESLKDVLEKARLTWPTLNLRANLTTFAGIRTHETNGDFILKETAPSFFESLGIESPGLTSAPAIAGEWGREIAEQLGLTKKETLLPPYQRGEPFIEMSTEQIKAAYEEDPSYGALVCRCESVTEKEIVESIRRPLGATNVDGVKRRTRAGMGRCQGGFCSPRVMEIIARELKINMLDVTKSGGESRILTGTIDGGACE